MQPPPAIHFASMLERRRILLGVGGGVAAYKAAELARELCRRGARVQAVLTPAGTAFVTPLTFQALTGHPARSALFDPQQEAAMSHIELARWAEAVLIAPATADLLARLRAGLADDLLTALCLASEAPLFLAPAMNRVMWQHPATCENLAVLRTRGAIVIGPDAGAQACGETGPGRLLEPGAIADALDAFFAPKLLTGLSVLITAGPTREAIDPVRFLSNRSSGKMGYALARAAWEAGAQVHLVSGPVALHPPPVQELETVESAAQMHAAALRLAPRCDIFIGAAAVADYTPAEAAPAKLKKHQGIPELRLQPTPDILADVARLSPRPYTVGFAAETDDLEANARAKLSRKHLDLVAANWVGRTGEGFDSDENELFLYWEGGELPLGRAPKLALARELIRVVAQHYHAADRPTQDSR